MIFTHANFFKKGQRATSRTATDANSGAATTSCLASKYTKTTSENYCPIPGAGTHDYYPYMPDFRRLLFPPLKAGKQPEFRTNPHKPVSTQRAFQQKIELEENLVC